MLTYKFLHCAWLCGHWLSRDLPFLSLSLQMIQRTSVSKDDSPYTVQRWLQVSEQPHVSTEQLILAFCIAHFLRVQK